MWLAVVAPVAGQGVVTLANGQDVHVADFYPISMLQESSHLIFRLNPLTLIIEQARAVVLTGVMPDLVILSLYLTLAWASLAGFHRMKMGVADVL